MSRYTMANLVLQATAESALGAETVLFTRATTQQRIVNNAIEWLGTDFAKHGLLEAEYSFYTTSGTTSYPCPADWYAPILQTEWNTTVKNRLFRSGARHWQESKSGAIASGIDQFYRLRTGTVGSALAQQTERRIWLDPTPTAREQIRLEYRSQYWMQDDQSKTVTNVDTTSDQELTVTSASHGLSLGDVVAFADVVGTTELNHLRFTVSGGTADTFSLQGTDGDDFTAYTSGGSAIPLFSSYDLTQDATSINWLPMVPAELVLLGLTYRLNMASGLAYFDHKDQYEQARDQLVADLVTPRVVNMGLPRTRRVVGIPETGYPSS